MTAQNFPNILMIMVCLQCTLGGAEKRYARVFEMLIKNTNGTHRLIVNRSMLNLLQDAGILTDTRHLIILDPPSTCHRLLNSWKILSRFVDSIWYSWHCWRSIQQYQPDIVHPLLTAVYFYLPILLFRDRPQLIMSAYSYQFESIRDRRIFGLSIGSTLKRWAMKRAKVIDALSGSIRTDLIQRGISSDRIIVAPSSFTDLSNCHSEAIREKWVVFLGRFVHIKNPLLLAQAIPGVLAKHPDAKFYFLGEGTLQDELEKYISSLQIEENVQIYFEPVPTQLLQQSSIFVSLQTEENYPSQSLLEAMACGNAIVATNVGETWRLVDDENGLRVDIRTESIAAGIIQLLDNPNLYELGQKSRQHVLLNHTPERYFDYISTLYRQAMNSDNHPNKYVGP